MHYPARLPAVAEDASLHSKRLVGHNAVDAADAHLIQRVGEGDQRLKADLRFRFFYKRTNPVPFFHMPLVLQFVQCGAHSGTPYLKLLHELLLRGQAVADFVIPHLDSV